MRMKFCTGNSTVVPLQIPQGNRFDINYIEFLQTNAQEIHAENICCDSCKLYMLRVIAYLITFLEIFNLFDRNLVTYFTSLDTIL